MHTTADKIFCILWVVFFAFIFSQIPSVIVQYSQRLGGSSDEVATFLQKFDEGAFRAGLNRHEAIESLLKNPERLVREQGLLARVQVVRFDRLSKQKNALGNGLSLGGIYAFAADYDAPLLGTTLADFAIGLPRSTLDALFAVFGGLLGTGSLLVLMTVVRSFGRRVET